MNRLQNLASHLTSQTIADRSNDVVICCALRTPITKAKRGLLKDTAPEIMLAAALRGILQKTLIDPQIVEDIAVGNTSQVGAGEFTARMAMLLAGYP